MYDVCPRLSATERDFSSLEGLFRWVRVVYGFRVLVWNDLIIWSCYSLVCVSVDGLVVVISRHGCSWSDESEVFGEGRG